MATRGLLADDAFAVLVTTSQQLNRKLVDVAAEFTATGALPTRGSNTARSSRGASRYSSWAERSEIC